MKPNTPLCGPVCGFEGGVGNDTSEAPNRPCWASVTQLWPAVAKGNCQGEPEPPKKSNIQPLPL